jgi:hypothetical protein
VQGRAQVAARQAEPARKDGARNQVKPFFESSKAVFRIK